MTKELLGIALRNITRNRRRTTLNVIALMVGMTIMILALGWIRGYFTTLYQGMITLDTGEVQILHRSYLAEQRRMPLDLLVDGALAQRLEVHQFSEQQRRFSAVTRRIEYEVELGNGREYMPMRGRGVDPLREPQITRIHEAIVAGSYLEAGEEGVLIGAEAARLLGLSAGDPVFLRVRDRFGAPNTVSTRVQGVFATGYPLFDRNLLQTDVSWSADFLRTGEGVTHLVARLDGRADRALARQVAAEIALLLPDDLQAYPWERFARTMVAAVEADMIAFIILLGIIFLLVTLGILNSMSMTVHEREQEIATMRAIGLKKRQLRWLLLAESGFLALVAAVLSWVFGGAMALYIQQVGFDISGFLPPELPIPFGDRFYGDYRFSDLLGTALVGVIITLIGTILPARQASLKPPFQQ